MKTWIIAPVVAVCAVLVGFGYLCLWIGTHTFERAATWAWGPETPEPPPRSRTFD